MNYIEHNRNAWNVASAKGIQWSEPVDSHILKRAIQGDWAISLMGLRPVPQDWFGDVQGKRILCLGAGGGQQVPILAAAGAVVTSFDNSDAQLEKDKQLFDRLGIQSTQH